MQSNLTILGFRPQAITVAEIHAEWPISLELEGTLPQPWRVPRSREQVPANHQHWQLDDGRPSNADGRCECPHRRYGDDLRPDGARGSTERRRNAGEEMMHTRAVRISAAALIAAVAASPWCGRKRPPRASRRPRPALRRRPQRPISPSPPANFEYAAEGRRDPFVSLVHRGADPQATGDQPVKRAEGVPGLMVSELTVRGIVQTRGAWVAMVARSSTARSTRFAAGDKLADGVRA